MSAPPGIFARSFWNISVVKNPRFESGSRHISVSNCALLTNAPLDRENWSRYTTRPQTPNSLAERGVPNTRKQFPRVYSGPDFRNILRIRFGSGVRGNQLKQIVYQMIFRSERISLLCWNSMLIASLAGSMFCL